MANGTDATIGNGGLSRWIIERLERVERGQEHLEEGKADESDVSDFKTEVREHVGELKRLMNWVIATLVTFAFTVAGSAIVIAISHP